MKSGFLKNILKTKNADQMLEESKKAGLKKTLTGYDLIVLGIGAIVGSGIFTLVGMAAAGTDGKPGAGPALIISFILAAVACVFSALCYAEFASMIPVAGSAYTYTFATMGELAAWLVGWILMLEYAIGNITVACSWTGYLFQFLKGFDKILPSWIVNPPIWAVNDYTNAVIKYQELGMDPHQHIPYLFHKIPLAINYPALFIMFIVTSTLIKGINESKKMASTMVLIKLAVIALFIIVGAFYIRPENWVPFAPNGIKGVCMGAFAVFFAYIGFDAISTAAEETKNPQKDLPMGIIGSLIVCTLIYILLSLVLTGMVPWNTIDIHAPIAFAMRSVHQDWVAGFISIGALTGLTSVLLVLQLGTTRILYAMARDNFFPSVFKKIHPKYQTPHVITWAAGFLVMVGVLFLNLGKAADLCNFGALTSFIIVCIGILILRKTDPDRPRPFKVPLVPLFPILGILSCCGLMLFAMRMKGMWESTILFLFWIFAGVVIYFSYGYKKNREVEALKAEAIETETPAEAPAFDAEPGTVQ